MRKNHCNYTKSLEKNVRVCLLNSNIQLYYSKFKYSKGYKPWCILNKSKKTTTNNKNGSIVTAFAQEVSFYVTPPFFQVVLLFQILHQVRYDQFYCQWSAFTERSAAHKVLLISLFCALLSSYFSIILPLTWKCVSAKHC